MCSANLKLQEWDNCHHVRRSKGMVLAAHGITGWEIWTVIGLAQKYQRLGPDY